MDTKADEDFTEVMTLGFIQVPKVWKYMLPEDLQYFQIPHEKRATCFQCPNASNKDFHPIYRCCTYNPRIPNFLLGMALEDSKTAPLIEKMIHDGFATPEGMIHTPSQHEDSLSQYEGSNHGENAKVFCRFLEKETGACGIYAYRNTTCSTYHCLHEYGIDSANFWDELQSLGGQVETALSQWAMNQAGVSPQDYFQILDNLSPEIHELSHKDTKNWKSETLKVLWGEYFGKEKEFFLACADQVKQNRSKLYDIACSTKLGTSTIYETNFRESLPDDLKLEFDQSGPISDSFKKIEDIWYSLQVAHHHVRNRIHATEKK